MSCGIFAGVPVLDLDYDEDSAAEADSNFVLTDNGGLVEIQATAEQQAFSEAQFGELLALARAGTAELFAAQRKAQELGNDVLAQTQIQTIKAAREKAMQTRRDEFFASNAPFYHTNRFAGVKLDSRMQRFTRQDLTWATIRLNRLLLEAAYPDAIAKSPGGVYPDLEIRIASVEDSSKSFTDYVEDARRRLEHDMRQPNEPRQIRPGEDVKYDEATGRIQVSGQVAVMSINGLLTKVMFDKNPDHEFYVEESFPLDWMYPHLTPSGIIMKINREPLPEMTQEIVDAVREIEREKGIETGTLVAALAHADNTATANINIRFTHTIKRI